MLGITNKLWTPILFLNKKPNLYFLQDSNAEPSKPEDEEEEEEEDDAERSWKR